MIFLRLLHRSCCLFTFLFGIVLGQTELSKFAQVRFINAVIKEDMFKKQLLQNTHCNNEINIFNFILNGQMFHIFRYFLFNFKVFAVIKYNYSYLTPVVLMKKFVSGPFLLRNFALPA